MKFSEKTYNVVSVNDFLDHLVSVKAVEGDSDELLDQISDSGSVSFGDAVDTLVSAKMICDILGCDVPSEVNPNMLVGLGS